MEILDIANKGRTFVLNVTTRKDFFKEMTTRRNCLAVLVDKLPKFDNRELDYKGNVIYMGYTENVLPKEVQAEILLSGDPQGLFKNGKVFTKISKMEYIREHGEL